MYIGVIKISFSFIFNKEIHALRGLLSQKGISFRGQSPLTSTKGLCPLDPQGNFAPSNGLPWRLPFLLVLLYNSHILYWQKFYENVELFLLMPCKNEGDPRVTYFHQLGHTVQTHSMKNKFNSIAYGIKKNMFVCRNPTDPRKTCRLLFVFFFLISQKKKKERKRKNPTDPLFLHQCCFVCFFLRLEEHRKNEYMESMNVKTSIWKKEDFHTHGQKKGGGKRPTDLDFFLTLWQTNSFFLSFFFFFFMRKSKGQGLGMFLSKPLEDGTWMMLLIYCNFFKL